LYVYFIVDLSQISGRNLFRIIAFHKYSSYSEWSRQGSFYTDVSYHFDGDSSFCLSIACVFHLY